MPKIDIRMGTSTVAVFAFETERIGALYGPQSPTLRIPYELKVVPFKATNEPGMPLHPVTCLNLSGELGTMKTHLLGRFREDVCFYEDQPISDRQQQGFVDIPLDIFTVESIERERTGNFIGILRFRAVVAVHSQGAGNVAQRFENATSADSAFTVQKSHWIEQILPNLGYGRVEILEVRLSPTRSFGLPEAVKEIREAQVFLTAGDWDNVVSHCRNAIEAVPKSQNLQLPPTATFRNRVDTFMSDCFGNKLGNDEAKYLAESMKSLWSLCSRPNHPSSSIFKRADAEFVLRNTMALTEYFGRLLP